RLIGGCMDILQMYPGTPYDKIKEFNEKYKADGFIWFMESCDLNRCAKVLIYNEIYKQKRIFQIIHKTNRVTTVGCNPILKYK
ncbi:MAG: hypothetical protein II245_04465, partial [Bacteroidaceae bacterium]|nr:hypothetical protein [Bacteroidaceae bacterium]